MTGTLFCKSAARDMKRTNSPDPWKSLQAKGIRAGGFKSFCFDIMRQLWEGVIIVFAYIYIYRERERPKFDAQNQINFGGLFLRSAARNVRKYQWRSMPSQRPSSWGVLHQFVPQRYATFFWMPHRHIYVDVRNTCVLFCFKKGADYVGHQIELQSRPASAARGRRPPAVRRRGRPAWAQWAHGPHGTMKVCALMFCWSDYVGSAGLSRTPTYIYIYIIQEVRTMRRLFFGVLMGFRAFIAWLGADMSS